MFNNTSILAEVMDTKSSLVSTSGVVLKVVAVVVMVLTLTSVVEGGGGLEM